MRVDEIDLYWLLHKAGQQLAQARSLAIRGDCRGASRMMREARSQIKDVDRLALSHPYGLAEVNRVRFLLMKAVPRTGRRIAQMCGWKGGSDRK